MHLHERRLHARRVATIAAGSAHARWLSLARSVNAEGSRVNDEVVSPPHDSENEKHSEETRHFLGSSMRHFVPVLQIARSEFS